MVRGIITTHKFDSGRTLFLQMISIGLLNGQCTTLQGAYITTFRRHGKSTSGGYHRKVDEPLFYSLMGYRFCEVPGYAFPRRSET